MEISYLQPFFLCILQPNSSDLHIETIIHQVLIVSRRLSIIFIANRSSSFPESWILKERQVPTESNLQLNSASSSRYLVLLD